MNNGIGIVKNFCHPDVELRLSKKRGRCSGGVLVLVKNSLRDFVQEIKNDVDNVVSLKFISHLNNAQTQQFILISTYIPPVQSPFYEHLSIKNGIHILEQFISHLKETFIDFPILLCGDFNSGRQ